jgi:hypothetical protein
MVLRDLFKIVKLLTFLPQMLRKGLTGTVSCDLFLNASVSPFVTRNVYRSNSCEIFFPLRRREIFFPLLVFTTR